MQPQPTTVPQASIAALESLGIDQPAGFDGTFATFHLLSPQDRISVTRWVKNYVTQNPVLFTPETVAVAEQFGDVADLDDASFDYDLFWTEVGNNASDLVIKPVQNIGATSGLLLNALPVILIAAAAYFLFVNSSKLKL